MEENKRTKIQWERPKVTAQGGKESNMPKPRSGHTFTVVGTNGFLFGGLGYGKPAQPNNEMFMLKIGRDNLQYILPGMITKLRALRLSDETPVGEQTFTTEVCENMAKSTFLQELDIPLSDDIAALYLEALELHQNQTLRCLRLNGAEFATGYAVGAGVGCLSVVVGLFHLRMLSWCPGSERRELFFGIVLFGPVYTGCALLSLLAPRPSALWEQAVALYEAFVLRWFGELIIALKGIFASVDAKIFREFEKETMEHNPNTQALNSITTFVIDSMSDEDD